MNWGSSTSGRKGVRDPHLIGGSTKLKKEREGEAKPDGDQKNKKIQHYCLKLPNGYPNTSKL